MVGASKNLHAKREYPAKWIVEDASSYNRECAILSNLCYTIMASIGNFAAIGLKYSQNYGIIRRIFK